MRVNTAEALPVLLLAAALPALLGAQAPDPAGEHSAPKPADTAGEVQAAAKPLTNTDLIAYSQEMQDDDSLLKLIAASDTRFDLSSDGLLTLKKAGVTDRVIVGMLEASRRSRSVAVTGHCTAPVFANQTTRHCN